MRTCCHMQGDGSSTNYRMDKTYNCADRISLEKDLEHTLERLGVILKLYKTERDRANSHSSAISALNDEISDLKELLSSKDRIIHECGNSHTKLLAEKIDLERRNITLNGIAHAHLAQIDRQASTIKYLQEELIAARGDRDRYLKATIDLNKELAEAKENNQKYAETTKEVFGLVLAAGVESAMSSADAAEHKFLTATDNDDKFGVSYGGAEAVVLAREVTRLRKEIARLKNESEERGAQLAQNACSYDTYLKLKDATIAALKEELKSVAEEGRICADYANSMNDAVKTLMNTRSPVWTGFFTKEAVRQRLRQRGVQCETPASSNGG